MNKVAQYAKLVAAVIGAALQAGALTLLPEEWKPYASIVLAVLTAAGVYAVPNAQPGGTASDDGSLDGQVQP